MIAGFDGWGNALKISSGMATYLIRKLNAKQFAKINPDTFFRYDEARPIVRIEDGMLKSLAPPGGSFYAVQIAGGKNDIVILKTDEPNLRWHQFVEEMLALCRELGVRTIITLGSMYDNVLHTDRVISGLASTDSLVSMLKEKNVNSISYHGPSAIHSIIQAEGPKAGFHCISLWCHCPFYLQGTTHFGILSHLGSLLSSLGDFELDTADLEERWRSLNEQIQELIEGNAEIQSIISELRKSKVRGSTASMKGTLKDEKVIDIKDFLEPK
ncbi:MAG: PAC2 family protein [Desulfobacterales bacterium]|nr:MAG: PAC2 family protein [Desulfobacterales bacterium]